MYCSNGHEFLVGKQSPKFCPVCGVPVTNQCPNGHDLPAGVNVCPLCNADVPIDQFAEATTRAASWSTPTGPKTEQVLPPIPPAETSAVVHPFKDAAYAPPAAATAPVPSRSRAGLVVGLVVGGIILIGGGVAVGLSVGHHASNHPATSQPTVTSPGASTSPTQPTQNTTTTIVPPTSTTLAPGLVPVDSSAVSSDSDATKIALTFETYFGGIDSQNWNLAYSAYSSQYQAQVSETDFKAADGTSSDTNVAITAIMAGALGSTVADVKFTSAQSATDGPVPGETCTDWTLTYTLVPGTSASLSYRINSAALTGAGHVGCPGQP